MPLSWFDQHLNQLLFDVGNNPNYWLSGTIFILIYAYLIRFLALALGSVESGMANITPAIGDSGRMLGSPQGKIMRDLYLPMLKGSLWTGALLLFVDVMKELPAKLMLQPFNFQHSRDPDICLCIRRNAETGCNHGAWQLCSPSCFP